MAEYELKSRPGQRVTIDDSYLAQARALVEFVTQPPYDLSKVIQGTQYSSLDNIGIFTTVIDIVNAKGGHLPILEDELVLRVCVYAIESKSRGLMPGSAEAEQLDRESRPLTSILD